MCTEESADESVEDSEENKCTKVPGMGSQQECVEDPDGPGREMVHFGKGLQPMPRKLV